MNGTKYATPKRGRITGQWGFSFFYIPTLSLSKGREPYDNITVPRELDLISLLPKPVSIFILQNSLNYRAPSLRSGLQKRLFRKTVRQIAQRPIQFAIGSPHKDIEKIVFERRSCLCVLDSDLGR